MSTSDMHFRTALKTSRSDRCTAAAALGILDAEDRGRALHGVRHAPALDYLRTQQPSYQRWGYDRSRLGSRRTTPRSRCSNVRAASCALVPLSSLGSITQGTGLLKSRTRAVAGCVLSFNLPARVAPAIACRGQPRARGDSAGAVPYPTFKAPRRPSRARCRGSGSCSGRDRP